MTPEGVRRADLAITGERISAIGDGLHAACEVDASGKVVLPGCVDLHVHLASTPSGLVPLDDFALGTRAAAAGGVTTVVAFAYQRESGSLREAAERTRAEAEAAALVDFSFHLVVNDPTPTARAELPALVRDGYAGLKVFMVSPRFAERTADYLELYRAASAAGALVAIHAEDHALIARRTAELHGAGRTGAEWFPESRPPEAEEIAVRAAVDHARETGVAIYLVHLSSRGALAALRDARATGVLVHGETRPLYLYLTRERYQRPDGALWVGQPPLREPEDVAAVWLALADGTLSTVGTDHVPHLRAKKLDPNLSFDRIPPGVSNLETLLPMLYSEGVRKGRLTLTRLVEVLASSPARIAGMFPRKGALSVGSDADVVVFDPNARRTVRASELHSACDYDPYEGWEVVGWPAAVISRGALVYADGELRGSAGRGRFVERSPVESGTPTGSAL